MIEQLQPWTRMVEVLGVLSPLFVFAVLLSLLIYFLFMFLAAPVEPASQSSRMERPGEEQKTAPGGDEWGYLGSFSYLLMASLFGTVIGMLVQLFGGFAGLNNGENTIAGAAAATVIVALGVAGTLFSETGRISLKRPLGSIALLVSFLVSGVYWQFLVGAAA